MSLHAAFKLQRGALALDVDLKIEAGHPLALVGPNGAGKSTLLMALAGLLSVNQGSICLNGQEWDVGSSQSFVPPEHRKLGVLFQDNLLFPHLSVQANVTFGLHHRGHSKTSARSAALSWLDRLGVASVASLRPDELSGGQARRVALARALATQPDLLLLDEPFAAIDASSKRELRRELGDHLKDFEGTCLVIVHDVSDAFALARDIAVMEQGRIIQSGPIAAIGNQPRSQYIADLIGLNYLQGDVAGSELRLSHGATLTVATTISGPALATVHPRALALYPERPTGSPRNTWQAEVLGIEPALNCLRIQLGGPIPLVAEVTQSAVNDLKLQPGAHVWLALKATEINLRKA